MPRPLNNSKIREFVYLGKTLVHFRRNKRVLPFPMALQVQTQSFCNGQCPACPHVELRKQQPQGTMAPELFEKIARESAAEPLFSSFWFMLQNEPLLDRDIFARIKHFKTMNPSKQTVLVTNGELIDQFLPAEIIAAGVDVFMISLNAHTQATFERINEGIDYHRVTGNIERLLSYPEMRERISLSFVRTELNKDEIVQAVRFWRKRGVKTNVLFCSNRAGAVKDHDRYYAPRDRFVKRPWDVRTWSSRYYRWRYYKRDFFATCLRPFCFMCILFNGDVIVCCHDWRRSPVIGNVATQPLASVWNAPLWNELRTAILRREYDRLVPCSQCNLVDRSSSG